MRKNLLIALVQLTAFSLFAQEESLWKAIQQPAFHNNELLAKADLPNAYKLFNLNLPEFQAALRKVTENKIPGNEVLVLFPNDEGDLERFRVHEASVMAPDLQEQFPTTRSFAGVSVENPGTIIRFSVSNEKGFSGLIKTADRGTIIIDPLERNAQTYIVFNRKNNPKNNSPFACSTDEAMLFENSNNKSVLNNADDAQLRRFRLAMSCTGEYTAFHGGTVAGAMAAINATVTRVNGVFENDFNVRLILIGTNANVVYTNAATDPYSDAATGAGGAWNGELQSTLTSVIGEANYDVGHLFGATGGGGNAGCIGCVCVNGQKGSGYTSPADGIPQGDNFDIDYVAHELGHQFGANHTFTHATQVAVAQLEPGSGSTIMGYAGITGATDVQQHSDAYFHAISIQQVTNNVKGKGCPTLLVTGNAVPTANAGADKTLPIGTAFKLMGSGTDANGLASLTYCWEQMDIGDATTTYPNTTKVTGPNFRSFSPTASPMRRFPRLADHVANGVGGNMWEIVPGVDRTLNFRFTVRDNRSGGACNESDNMTVFFDNAYGPFSVTSQNTSGISWAIGSTQSISWSVNNTTALTGSANVNILLSTDGGVTFPITLLANTPNDGTQTITVPDILSTNCRLLIEPTGNDYYAINTMPFAIGYSITTTCTDYTYNTSFTIPDNNTAYTVKSINVPTNLSVTDVNLRVVLNHSYVSDLQIALVDPNGTNQINVFNRSCTNNDNMNVLFDDQGVAMVCASPINGTYLPSQALSVYNGTNPQGNWLVGIRDLGAADVGTVSSYTLTICSKTYTELAVACGAVTSNWNGTSWSNGAPSKNTAVTLNGNYDTLINGSFTCCSLAIANGSLLKIGNNSYVNIINDLTVNAGGILDVDNSGSLVMVNNSGVVTNNGTSIVRKTSSFFDNYDYTFWSSPVHNLTIGGALSSWQQTNIFKLNAANYRDDNNDSYDDNGDAWVFTPQSEVMIAGKGYAAMASTTGVFPRQDNVLFNGKVNNGIITIPVNLSLDNVKNNDDFNLIGNPYPSAINANDFIAANAGVISGTLYFWTHVGNYNGSNYSPNDFAYYNLSGGTATSATGTGNTSQPNGLIASGQGFQVDASVNGNVVFNNGMRNLGYSNSNFYRSTEEPQTERDRIWLNLIAEDNVFSQQLIGFFPEATSGVDYGYDGQYTKTNTSAVFYSVIDGEEYKIQGRGPFDVNDVIALGFRSEIDKTYSVSIADTEGVLESQNIYVEDRLLHVVHNLKTSDYVFSTAAGEFNNRFVLRFTNAILGNGDFETNTNSVAVFVDGGIAITSSSERIKDVFVYDVLGRLVVEKRGVDRTSVSLSNVRETKEVLLVKVVLDNGQTTTKKVLY
ncbi:MAG TPA: zinc-dependent metalloprotease family protein [Flavobacterium sp.]|uniref:reprolysin-like metallopeptidase n=1 Tax=Flavobacterium sp. TaxID=239 RepID=UPI002B655341|nr:zinc-dependent metalloprotease family protein [Flavobacterium sp.]HSD13993.1 zinc-dependent metalloprotease family protein [Flavobacterium sp.]